MRKNPEINKAIGILQKKGDKLSMIQIEVLSERCTEICVFERYVQNVSNENRDEAAYCAARDAARYLYGKLELEELIPDASNYPEELTTDTLSLPTQEEMWKMIQKLSGQVECLKRQIHEMKKDKSARKITVLPQKGKKREEYIEPDKEEYLTPVQASEYVGCSITSLKIWKRKGLISFCRETERSVQQRRTVQDKRQKDLRM